MILKEIRKSTVDKKGKDRDKLVCELLFKKGTICISIKDRNFKEPVVIDILELLSPYLNRTLLKNIKRNINLKLQSKAS